MTMTASGTPDRPWLIHADAPDQIGAEIARLAAEAACEGGRPDERH